MVRSAIPNNVALETDLLPFGPMVRANAHRMKQVLINLITNGWEAICKDRGTVFLVTKTIRTSDIPETHLLPVGWEPGAGACACLEVTDTGCGIRKEDMYKIFDPFFSTQFLGRGLGLAVVLGITKSWGGAVGVESTLGQGTTFRIFLPEVMD